MKEGKKPTAKKHISSSSNSKRVVPKNQTPKMPERKSEPPKVKKVNVEEINKDFDDVENDDRRLIVFIAIAILVIVGTIIGLLVGCEKKEHNTPEPGKPGTDVIVPEKPDEKDNEDDGVRTKEIVRKVRSNYYSKNKKKTNNGKKDNEDEETVTYTVTYYLGEESETKEVESGKDFPTYVPTGYSTCSYFKDENLTEEYDVTQPVSENVNVYMSCEVIDYTVIYESTDDRATISTSNPTKYNVEDGTIELSNPEVIMNNSDTTVDEGQTLYFGGWYADQSLSTSISSLNKDVLEYANSNDEIHIYAKLTEEEVAPTTPDTPNDPEPSEPVIDEDSSYEADSSEIVLEEPTEEELVEEILEETESSEIILEEVPEEIEQNDPVITEPIEEEPIEEVIEETEPNKPVLVEEPIEEPAKEEIHEEEKPVEIVAVEKNEEEPVKHTEPTTTNTEKVIEEKKITIEPAVKKEVVEEVKVETIVETEDITE